MYYVQVYNYDATQYTGERGHNGYTVSVALLINEINILNNTAFSQTRVVILCHVSRTRIHHITLD